MRFQIEPQVRVFEQGSSDGTHFEALSTLETNPNAPKVAKMSKPSVHETNVHETC